MASLESLRSVSIGEYLPTGSVVHRIDARAKLLISLILGVAIFAANGYLVNLALVLLLVAFLKLARLSPRFVASTVKPALPLILLLTLMQLLFYGEGPAGSTVYLRWGALVISSAGVRMVVISLLRFGGLLALVSLLTNTTTTSALHHGVEWWLRPLTAVGLPGHELGMVMAIALRFLPILGEELEAISHAQAARTLVAERRSRWQFIRRARRTANLIVPLFVSTLRHADEMAFAMQARCYQGGRGRTQLNVRRWQVLDTLSLALAVIILMTVLILHRLPLP
ncbi:MAG: energy-coupling factor transporter transmembrane protein EcfT [Chloroflexi bacterium]|nr:energy-coupling factor transporter transmembrane protein EcfT [Chloroflexota bacterium]